VALISVIIDDPVMQPIALPTDPKRSLEEPFHAP
jgi:hypothetical protein